MNARYIGSAHHKSKPADYCFNPPANPRPGKSLCDGLRVIRKIEATRLFRSGIRSEMVSSYVDGNNGLPKYVWAVDKDGEAYEAKMGPVITDTAFTRTTRRGVTSLRSGGKGTHDRG